MNKRQMKKAAKKLEGNLQGLWVMASMSTTFPDEGTIEHPEATGSLYYKDGNVYAAIYRLDDKLPECKLQFQYAARYELLPEEQRVIHHIYDAHKPSGPAPHMIKPESRNFRIDEEGALHITGKSVQHNATINIKWVRPVNLEDHKPA